MIVAGESSGDHHGARLVRALAGMVPDAFVFGIGGRALEAAGVRLFAHARDLSVVGLTEIAGKLPEIVRALWTATEMLARMRPDVLILIDFPDFNFRVARAAKKLGIPVLYYISPQVWAWRKGRVKTIRRLMDRMAVILPFEEAFYRERGVDATYVGHPLADEDEPGPEAPPILSPGDPGPLVGLLPGSRSGEVFRHLPILLEAARLVGEKMPGVKFAIPLAPDISGEWIQGMMGEAAKSAPLPEIRLLPGGIRAVLTQSRMAVTVSGTVTLEAALAGLPMIIVYRMSGLSILAAKALIRVDFIGLPNLIAGRLVAPELIQEDVNPKRISGMILDWLGNPEKLAAIRRDMEQVRKNLGGPGASARAAALAVELLGQNRELPGPPGA